MNVLKPEKEYLYVMPPWKALSITAFFGAAKAILFHEYVTNDRGDARIRGKKEFKEIMDFLSARTGNLM